MYLRLNHQQMRFRLTRDDLALLLQQGRIDEALPMPLLQLHGFAVALQANHDNQQISVVDNILLLSLAQNIVDQLTHGLPTKEGIVLPDTVGNHDSFALVIEIDVRQPRKKML